MNKKYRFTSSSNVSFLQITGCSIQQTSGTILRSDGYQSLAKALREMTPEQVIAEIKASGLRGQGRRGVPDGSQMGRMS